MHSLVLSANLSDEFNSVVVVLVVISINAFQWSAPLLLISSAVQPNNQPWNNQQTIDRKQITACASTHHCLKKNRMVNPFATKLKLTNFIEFPARPMESRFQPPCPIYSQKARTARWTAQRWIPSFYNQPIQTEQMMVLSGAVPSY